MSQVMSQVDIEKEGRRLALLLEHETEELAGRARTAAQADAEYKKTHAQELLRAEGPTVGEREAKATIASSDVYLERKIAEANQLVSIEKCRNLRAQLDWLRTIAANVRAQVTG